MIFYIIALMCILVLSLCWLTNPNFLQHVQLSTKIPGPMCFPIIGCAHLFFNISTVELCRLGYSLGEYYGNVYRVWLFNTFFVVMSHPNEVESLLGSTKHLNKTFIYDPLHVWLADGLLTSKAKKWHRRRKIITPAFHFKILEQFVGVFHKHSSIMMDELRQYKPNDAVNLQSFVSLFTLDAICETAMGTCINALTNKDTDYVKAVFKVAHNMQSRIFSVQRIPLFYWLGNLRRENNKCLHILHGFTDGIIQKRRANLMSDSASQSTASLTYEELNARGLKNFVDVLLHARTEEGESLSNADIREEVDTFMFEGHDTTTAAITFCLYHIARYPDVQRKCFDEMRSVLGDDRNAPATIGQLRALPYLDMVIKETLRLYPSVPLIGRIIDEETKIGDHTYPAGTNAMVSIYNMGRNPELYDEPNLFRPERFDGGGHTKYTGDHQPFAYVPFSAGPRNCIGQKFAELEVKSLLTKMLRTYELELHADSIEMPAIDVALILMPSEPLLYHLKERVYA